ncbi:MAG TPA: valine--tRNA ligase [Candidatus Saccharimonadales bacterium]|nr:valine--tRNA ligase [Candidatus Saccharimonadales bacterium]
MKLPKVYQSEQYESDIYKKWEESGAFEPTNRGNDGIYSIVMPPPNANGDLHIGYELTAALEDIAIRYHRMKGEKTLLIPGADHAGFETQVVYEKHLAKQGKSRFDYSREELYQQIWDFVAKNRGNFESQMRKMGVSSDWSRFTFTLDEKIIKTAYRTFKKMWDEDLIYRGERLVNFCTFHGTSFSDIEVVYREVAGHLWYIKYPLTDGSGHLAVATTRPETMLGDTAVAVNPKDVRYTKFVGKTIKLPLTHREIPIIADEFVDKDFGTGAVKVTPAHDPNDYDMGMRHDLPFISVIDYEGKMTAHVPEVYRGLDVKEARHKVVEDLKEQGFLEKVEDHQHSVGHCYKCDTVIEPLLKDQWFVSMKPLAEQAIKALKADKIEFYPRTKLQQSITYLEQIRDWNISRQIAWGIPIPAFQNVDNPDDWIYDERVDQETIEVDGKTYRRDPDVFDTWFSSGSWPYSTLDFPDGTDFKEFYPLSLMETGGEILYQWVCRMIMLGLYNTGDVPFKAVYIHGYVMAEDGSKMSKSIGNVVDPMPVIEQYGSDALRMGIVAGRSAAVNRGYDSRKVEEARNFANKLWNIARFIEGKVDNLKFGIEPQPKTIADDWILHKLQQLTEVVGEYLDSYRFAEAYKVLYHTVWDDLADWYIEASKTKTNSSIIAFALETVLKVAHPFAPFVTETIWQQLGGDSLLIVSPWPKVEFVKSAGVKDFEEVKTIVEEIRYITTSMKLAGVSLHYNDEQFIADNADLIKLLANLKSVTEVKEGRGLNLTSTSHSVWLDIDEQTAKAFVAQLADKKAEQGRVVKMLEDRLKNNSYVQNAPKNIVDQTKAQLKEAEELLAKISAEHERFAKH